MNNLINGNSIIKFYTRPFSTKLMALPNYENYDPYAPNFGFHCDHFANIQKNTESLLINHAELLNDDGLAKFFEKNSIPTIYLQDLIEITPKKINFSPLKKILAKFSMNKFENSEASKKLITNAKLINLYRSELIRFLSEPKKFSINYSEQDFYRNLDFNLTNNQTDVLNELVKGVSTILPSTIFNHKFSDYVSLTKAHCLNKINAMLDDKFQHITEKLISQQYTIDMLVINTPRPYDIFHIDHSYLSTEKIDNMKNIFSYFASNLSDNINYSLIHEKRDIFHPNSSETLNMLNDDTKALMLEKAINYLNQSINLVTNSQTSKFNSEDLQYIVAPINYTNDLNPSLILSINSNPLNLVDILSSSLKENFYQSDTTKPNEENYLQFLKKINSLSFNLNNETYSFNEILDIVGTNKNIFLQNSYYSDSKNSSPVRTNMTLTESNIQYSHLVNKADFSHFAQRYIFNDLGVFLHQTEIDNIFFIIKKNEKQYENLLIQDVFYDVMKKSLNIDIYLPKILEKTSILNLQKSTLEINPNILRLSIENKSISNLTSVFLDAITKQNHFKVDKTKDNVISIKPNMFSPLARIKHNLFEQSSASLLKIFHEAFNHFAQNMMAGKPLHNQILQEKDITQYVETHPQFHVYQQMLKIGQSDVKLNNQEDINPSLTKPSKIRI